MRLASKLALAAPLFVCMLANSASAQGWMADRARREGPGLRVGNLELHPGLGAEAGYDTNVFYEDDDPEGGFLLRLTAHLDVSTLGQTRRTEGETQEGSEGSSRNLDFRGGVAASYYHFFVDQARNNVSLDAYLNATINPEGRFSVYLHDEFARSIRPFVDRGGFSAGREVPTYARDRNTVGAEMRLQSSGGVLKGSLGYDYTLDYFEDEEFDYVNSHQHDIRLQLAWRFLPQTALLSITELTRQSYFNRDAGATSLLVDNWRVQSLVGINGGLTSTVSFTALVGYGGGFYNDPRTEEFDNIVVRSQVAWKPRQTMNFALGYQRTFTTSFLGNYAKRDRIYLDSELIFSGAFLLGLDLSVAFSETGIALAPDGTPLGNTARRDDTLVTATLYSEYRFTDWLALTASLGYYGDFTDYEYTFDSGGAIPDPGGGYQKFEAWLGLRAFY